MRKIGIFGGTFDPIHNAHIAVAKAARRALGLDFVIMMTGGNPPHKRENKILDAKLRHIMLKLAVRGEPELVACDWEVKRPQYSYTVNTLKFFSKLYPEDKIYFIIGGDSLEALDTWYMPEQICSLCTIAVYKRNNLHGVIEPIRKKYNADIVEIDGEFLDISSTALRADYDLMMKHTPPAVGEFIKKYGLYRDHGSDMEVLTRLLKPQRLRHSIGVAKLAAELADIYGADRDTAWRAGMLHDIAKNIDYETSLVMCGELEAELDPVERTIPALVHPKLGAELIKCLFGLTEGEITSAVRWHTVGRQGMTLLDKLIFVADMCEEGRSFPGVEDIRKAAHENLDRAALMCINSTIEYNLSSANPVHPGAYAVREWLLKNL